MSKFDYGYASSRMVAGQAIKEIGLKSDRVWGVTSDIGGALKDFRQNCPGRYIDTGIAEQTACGVAAGLALEGYKPYIIGMIPFITMRAFEQVRTDVCYQNLPVTIIGTGGGLVSTGGSTHNAMEDVSIMRTLANMNVVSISDPNMISSIIHNSLELEAPLFIRQAGGKSDRILYEPGSLNCEIGKGLVAREGNDATIVAHGAMVAYALDIAEELSAKGMNIRVIDMYSIKPLDNDLLLKAADETGKVLVVEDHLLRGGLSTAVAELYMDNGVALKKFKRLGIPDVYAGYGPAEELREKYGYGKAAITKTMEEFCK